MTNRIANIIAGLLLVFAFLMSLFSVKDDSLTMDELAHLPAGYSYLTQKDMRLNPEHPPLVKDLAALPLIFIPDIKFPSEVSFWQKDVNGQWDFGRYFLYSIGNPTEKMIFLARLPMILILILLGFYIFKWTRELFGNYSALLALFFFAFSPTLLAHGRLVTTDVAAAFGVVFATYYFIKAIKLPSVKNITFAGVAFGIAELLKFSLILLIPFFIFLGFISFLVKLRKFSQIVKSVFFVFLIGFILIGVVYYYHTLNYPPEKQLSDTKVYLKDTPEFIKNKILWAAEKPILRAYAHYLTGVAMIFQRVAGGNTTYFLGEVSNLGWWYYFPVVYLIKEPLAFQLLSLAALFYILWLLFKNQFWKNTFSKSLNWLKAHFPEFAMITFIGFYWLVSIKGSLNIGVRHLLPVFPFTMILVAAITIKLLKEPYLKYRLIVLIALIMWQVFSVITVYPYFLAYFNELVGGPDNGYKYVVDSNLDWGQDLKRLRKWVDEKFIDKIYIDYFGGGSPEYTLGKKFIPWRSTENPEKIPKGNYLAVSGTLLQGGRGKAIPGLEPAGYYLWLDKYQPVAKIGYSIFVYYID